MRVSLERSKSCAEVWSLESAVGGGAEESGGAGRAAKPAIKAGCRLITLPHYQSFLEKSKRVTAYKAFFNSSTEYCAELRIHVRDVGRAGGSSPASTERSEVIGLRDSPSIAEGRTGS